MRRAFGRVGPEVRRTLTQLWWWVAIVAASLGVVAAVLFAPRPALLLAAVVAFGLTFTIDNGVGVRDQVESGTWSALLAVGGVGWLSTSGTSPVPLVLVLAPALWPAHWVLRRVTGSAHTSASAGRVDQGHPRGTQDSFTSRRQHPAGGPRASHPIEPVRVRSMSTEKLCRAWVDSRVPLKLSDHPVQVQRMARLREAILDELEARDPDGVARWFADLGDGRRVDATPHSYLSGRDGSSWSDEPGGA